MADLVTEPGTGSAVEPAQAGFLDTGDRSFLGHPKGLAFLAFTEAWERFSFYGMSGLVLLYMIQHLLTPAVMGGVFGLAGFRSALEGLTGPLSDQAFASQIYGLYSGFVYFTPVFGGLLADKLLGQRRTVMLGAIIMSAGHILMAFEGAFLIAMLLLVIGTGCLKGNISSQVGHLYAPEDEGRRTRAFAIFSAAINIGAMTGPLITGWLMSTLGPEGFWVYIGVLFAALTIYAGWRRTRRPTPAQDQNFAVIAPSATPLAVEAALENAGSDDTPKPAG